MRHRSVRNLFFSSAISAIIVVFWVIFIQNSCVVMWPSHYLCWYHLYQLFNTDYRQARSCNKSLVPQSGTTGQETKVSLSNASHWIELVQEQLAYHIAIPQDCPQDRPPFLV